ncbi:hypothetical protein AAY473_007545 [Plecturocebus cupreus]
MKVSEPEGRKFSGHAIAWRKRVYHQEEKNEANRQREIGLLGCNPFVSQEVSAHLLRKFKALNTSYGTSKLRFHHVGQSGLELLTSSDPPASAS